ncbi:MAG: prepilin-type N-terminal cleavage/methylation domain-containing protein [Candidatus Riflebacteria bacterium]|nr:prepilin-type N-terminal cleavage/methylation domain-containing protein [Candidatus Riflebacteria bacterium]
MRLPSRRGVTLLEVIMAMVILTIAIVPMLDVFGVTGRTVAKSQNLSLAVGLSHKIAQHLLTMPYDAIVDKAETPLADGADDQVFNPLENPGTSQTTNRRITAAQLPELHAFLKKYSVRYALDVVGDAPKDVKIIITWIEQGRNMLYSLRVYVSRR